MTEEEKRQKEIEKLLGKGNEQPTPDPIEESIKEAEVSQQKTYNDILHDWNMNLAEQKAMRTQEQKRNSNLQLFSGITEAAAALTNLIGTTQGAAPQQWESNQPQLAQRVDAITKERDAKIQRYQDQITALQKQKSDLKASTQNVLTNYKLRKEQLQNADERMEASLINALLRKDTQDSKNETSTALSLQKNANALVAKYIDHCAKMGEEVSWNGYMKYLEKAMTETQEGYTSILDSLRK